MKRKLLECLFVLKVVILVAGVFFLVVTCEIDRKNRYHRKYPGTTSMDYYLDNNKNK